MTVSAPGIDRAIGAEGQVMEVAGGDSDDVREKAYAARPFDLDGNVAAARSESLAQLAEGVVATGPDAAIGFEHKRVRAGVTDGDGDEAVAALDLYRSVLLDDGAADAQLTLPIVTGRQRLGERLEQHTVVRACRYGADEHRVLHRLQLVAVGRGAVAQLPVGVKAGRQDLAACSQYQGMKSPSGDRLDEAGAGHDDGREPVGLGAVAQLPIVVETPGHHLAILAHHQAMKRTGRDRAGLFLDRHEDIRARGSAVSQLAVRVVPGCLYLVISIQDERMLDAGGHGDDPVGDIGKRVAVVVVAQPQFAITVIAAAVEIAVLAEKQAVISSGGDGLDT